MATYGQKKLNRADVRNATLRFVFSFIILTALSFLPVYLFFKSAQQQNNEIRRELTDYHNMLGRNELLKIKMDTVYYKMSLLSNDKVGNDIFLRNSIIEDINLSRQLMGKDSADDLKHYAMLLQDIQPMLVFKNDLIKKKAEEKAAIRNLQQCMGNINRVTVQPRAQNKRPGKLFNR